MGKKELVALLSLSSWCLLIVEWLFLALPWVGLQFVIAVYPDQASYSLIIPTLVLKAKGILLSPPSVCPLCYLLLNRWTKFNQIWCVSYSHEWGVQQQNFFGPAPWSPGERSKGQYHLISITKSISKIFIPNFVFLLTNERYKTYTTGFKFCCLGHAPGVGLRGAGDVEGVNKLFFSKMVMWPIKSTGMTSRTECK